MSKPKVTTNPVANQYSSRDERIVEYSHKGLGGLIGFRETEDGKLHVHLYRHDEDVRITVGTESPTDVIPFDLRLSFTPNAIREHFEGDDPDPTEGLTDEQLADVGRHALMDDGVYRAFHESLKWALDSDETKED